MHTDNRYKNILALGEGLTQGLGNTTVAAEAKYPINLTKSGKRFVLSLHFNGSSLFLFAKEIKNSEIKPHSLCFGNISKDFTITNMKKQG